jgi:3-methyladenine DNA glycosylase AlkD
MITTAAMAEATLLAMRDPARAEVLQRFFKAGPGEYGEGDVFLGIRVPALRKLVRELRGMPLGELTALLRSACHEARLLALIGMVEQYRRGDDVARERLYEAYMQHTRWINSWDLVDTSAEHIVGAHLWDRDRAVLRRLASSEMLWERRIAVLATFHFIRRGHFHDTLNIARLLLGDKEDLIHKAVGWMLRETGERDRAALDAFLEQHHLVMPRVMLRYAIEKHAPAERKRFLRK